MVNFISPFLKVSSGFGPRKVPRPTSFPTCKLSHVPLGLTEVWDPRVHIPGACDYGEGKGPPEVPSAKKSLILWSVQPCGRNAHCRNSCNAKVAELSHLPRTSVPWH
jgi:hypothetical protein